MSTLAESLLNAAASRALAEARARGLRVVVKTSVTPATTVYDARDVAPGLLERLGVKTHVIAVDERGNVVAELGEPAPTDFPLAVALWAAVAVLGFVVIAAAARALR